MIGPMGKHIVVIWGPTQDLTYLLLDTVTAQSNTIPLQEPVSVQVMRCCIALRSTVHMVPTVANGERNVSLTSFAQSQVGSGSDQSHRRG